MEFGDLELKMGRDFLGKCLAGVLCPFIYPGPPRYEEAFNAPAHFLFPVPEKEAKIALEKELGIYKEKKVREVTPHTHTRTTITKYIRYIMYTDDAKPKGKGSDPSHNYNKYII